MVNDQGELVTTDPLRIPPHLRHVVAVYVRTIVAYENGFRFRGVL